MITVRFYGGLKQFGDRYELAANSPAEAIYALTSQIAGLRKYIEAGVFKVRIGKRAVSQDDAESELRQGFEGTLHITPVARGSGKGGGLLMTIIGIVLIAVAYIYGGPAAGSAMGQMWSGVMALGVSLVLNGITMMLSKPPKPMEASGTSKNTAFSNLNNTVGQGKPIPVAYGLCYTGSKVVSMGVETRKLSNEQVSASAKSSKESDPKSNTLVPSEEIRRRFKSTQGLLAQKVIQSADKSLKDKADRLALDEPGLSESERQNRVRESLDIPANARADSRGWEFDVVKVPVGGVAAIAPNGVPYNTDFNHPSVAAQNYKSEFRVELDRQLHLKAAELGEIRRKLADAESEQNETDKKLQGQLSDDERRNLEKRLEVLDTEIVKLRKVLEV